MSATDAGTSTNHLAGPTTGAAHRRRRLSGIALALVAVTAALMPFTSAGLASVTYASADSVGTLLVSEQIIDNGTIALDAYGSEYLESRFNFYRDRGHYYDYFPLGTSLFSVPAVALFKAVGFDVQTQNAVIQASLAALLAAATVLLMYVLSRMFLPPVTSVLLATGFWFGSSLASTTATALWSHDLAVVLGLIALILLVRMSRAACVRCWLPLGLVLASAFVVRPTMAILAVFILVYLAFASRRDAVKTAAVTAVGLGLFVLFSEAVFREPLPVYYLPQRLAADLFGEALGGLLVSPSRGLLVFMPVLLMIPVFAAMSPSQTRARAGLLAVAVGWPILHWIAIARHGQWWSGFSYGPRLMTDVLPGLFLAAVLVWPSSFTSWPRRIALAATILLAAWGIWIHTVQGLHNPYTVTWNESPRVEDHPEKVFDWRYPQFLHDAQRQDEMSRLPEYQSGP